MKKTNLIMLIVWIIVPVYALSKTGNYIQSINFLLLAVANVLNFLNFMFLYEETGKNDKNNKDEKSKS